MTALVSSVVDVAVVLALALTATVVLRRRSAALRHAILASAIVAAAAMPALELVLPQARVIPWGAAGSVVSSGLTLTSGDAASAALTDASIAVSGEGVPWAAIFALIWMTGAIVTCAGLVTGLARLARLRSRCTPVTGRWRDVTDELSRESGITHDVALLQSDDPSLLVTCGVLNQAIILPAGASRWSDDRRRTVLLHELAHVRRHDAVLQLAGEALRVLQWPNPLVWLACRRLRQESEYACDDAVLRGGVGAAEYATHLLDVARHLSGRHATWASAAAIAHPSTLERRIAAMLNTQRNRAPFARRGWCGVALVALAVSIPLAAAGVAPPEQPIAAGSEARDVMLSAHEPRTAAPDIAPVRSPARGPDSRKQAPAAIAGVVLDQSGGILPGVQVTLTDPQTAQVFTQHTNAAGRFAFRDLRPAAYEIAASLSGFATFRGALTLGSGAAVERTITLPIGSLVETINITCSSTGAVPALQRIARAIADSVFPVLSAQEAPIRVGGSIREPKKIKDVKPACPSIVPAGETTIQLTGRVGEDGLMYDVMAVVDAGADPPADLLSSAIDAVDQWKFTPTLLNGVPVEVNISVRVTFRRS